MAAASFFLTTMRSTELIRMKPLAIPAALTLIVTKVRPAPRRPAELSAQHHGPGPPGPYIFNWIPPMLGDPVRAAIALLVVGSRTNHSEGSFDGSSPCPSAISKDRVKGSLKVTRAFGAGFLKLDDVKLMVDTNLEAYRFSISWSRLIPGTNGRGAVNPKGLEYYNNLIDALVQHGIQVHIMIYQLEYPQMLEDEYGGWLSPRIV